jgi:two-component system response regulator NreC
LTPIRIALIDDHTVLRSGVRALLEHQEDMVVVGEAADGTEGLEMVQREQPDVVLMDLSLPGLNGIGVTRRIREAGCSARILALTMHEDQRHVRQVLEAGATGYVSKRAADTELVDAIRAVHRGEVFLHPSVARSVLEGYLGTQPEPVPEARATPSERELEVLTLLAFGHTNQEVAEKLFISVKTVETHKARLVEKMGFRTRADLVRYALDRGLLQDL